MSVDFSNAQDLGSPEPIRIPYIIDKKKYVLQEAGEGTAAKIKTLAARGATVQDGKVTVGTHVGEVEAVLVSLCLWECNTDTGEPLRQVPLNIVQSWPTRIVKQLSEKAEEISGLKAVAESPERKALIAALKEVSDIYEPRALEQFVTHVKYLMEQNPTLYAPLWKLVEPREEFDPKK